MSREIKFRAWDGEKMWPDALRAELVEASVFDDIKLPAYYRPGFTNVTMQGLMQYTGLTDKNGVAIYEGDIVTAGSLVCVVEWYVYMWAARWNRTREGSICRPKLGFREHKVIGNIYENPELLEVER